MKKMINIKTILLAALVVCLAVMPFYISRRLTNVMILAMIYIMLGTSWNLLSGLAGLFSVTHVIFLGTGVYTMHVCTMRLGLPFISGIFVGLVLNIFVAAIVGIIGSKLKGLYFTMALIGIQSILYSIAVQAVGLTGGVLGISMPKVYLIAKRYQMLIALAMVIFYLLLYVYIRRSRMGTSLVALKDNPDLAMALGSNIVAWRVIATVVSACMASIVGVFYSIYMMSTNPEIYSGTISLKIIMVSIVGGVGSVWGPVLGSLLIVMDEYIRGAMPIRFATFSVIIYSMIMIVMIYSKPNGLVSLELFKKKTV